MNLSLATLAALLAGKLCEPATLAETLAATTFSINTRTLQAGDVYIAIKGPVYDGHDFIEQAIQAGALAVIAQRPVSSTVPVIIVNDTRQALAQLAAAWRQHANALIVGVTGSNGKTTVKEMLAAILAVKAPVLYTQGNLNNEIGVPLTLLRLQEAHRFAVIEMGANHVGEIAYTSACAQPDIVVINNVGDAHLEGFGSIDGVARAKGEIIASLKATGVAILNRDDRFYDDWLKLAGNHKSSSFGVNANADFRAEAITTGMLAQAFNTQFTLVTPTDRLRITLHLAGQHNVLNALAASAAASALGIPLEQIQQGLASMQPVKGRMQPLAGQQGNVLIDDTYNANPSSLKAALEVLAACDGERWLALGAFGELGPDSLKLHADLAVLIKNSGVTRLFATGADTQATVNAFGAGATYFAAQEDLINTLKQALSPNITLLIKGSRAQRMENVAIALMDSTGKQSC
jgi:UDP-N-acetylmuramoyl-tripeptide--D-alanyl-D-alanine ligase